MMLSMVKHCSRRVHVVKKKSSILDFYDYAYNQEVHDIVRVVSTLKSAKSKNLKEKYKKYIEMFL